MVLQAASVTPRANGAVGLEVAGVVHLMGVVAEIGDGRFQPLADGAP